MNYTLETCLEQQKKVDASITHNGTYMPWLAGIGEVIEMCEHLSLISTWKKQPEADMKQAFMELVDVFAFAMSTLNEYGQVDCEMEDKKMIADFYLGETIRHLLFGLTQKGTCLPLFKIRDICNEFFNRSINDVFYYYMGKQTLTRFRQDNGYKNGTYIKMWGNKEDNEYLTAALEQNVNIDILYSHLEKTYTALVIAKAVTE